MPAAGVAKPLRVQPQLRFAPRAGAAAWTKFQTAAGVGWRAAWDAATGVPSRVWGPGLAAPGAMTSPAVAELIARQVLADHLALLAPGAAITDFTLASNSTDGDIRSVGFVQMAGGKRVVGGQVSFRFKNDRLFVIASEALPDVKVAAPRKRLARTDLHARATDRLRTELVLPGAPVSTSTDEVILPLVGDDAVLGYRVAVPTTIDGGGDGKYLAYVDPDSGEILAVHQTNLYASGIVKYRGVDRNPMHPRVDRPATNAFITINGAPQTTSGTGTIAWSPDVVQTVGTSVTGPFVTIVNKGMATPTLATAEMPIAPESAVVWDATANAEDDAQVVTFLSVNKAKEFVRTHLDPGMPTLNDAITANVNLNQNCNAFFDGKAVNFFHASMDCQNTGLLEDVVFHEFGHAVHAAEIIDGVGSFDGAMSEGAADFLSAQMTNDSGMGRGFFYKEDPLRELDPPDKEFIWPNDIGEIHHTGLIYGGAMWDMRKTLIAQLGPDAGQAVVGKIYIGTLRRSVSIPTSLIEALAADDDDGDLTNGTPHECAIRDAYARHGLRTATGSIVAPGVLDTNAHNMIVRLDMSGLAERCGGDDIASVNLSWKASYDNSFQPGDANMTPISNAQYWGNLPLATDDSVSYQALVNFKDGSYLILPDNLADQRYQTYQGHTVKLYCTNFETNPFDEGWTTGAQDGAASPWEWGEPKGKGATDPPAAFSGTHVLAQKIDGDYEPKVYSFAQLPEIDVGQYSDVRLQYRRWLAVEDSEFDKARVTVNDQPAWTNFTANKGQSSAIHHIDKEWRFADIPLSYHVSGHKMRIAFDLAADEGLQLGGWQIDDLCVVANVNSICGDGVQQAFEQCDDGPNNADVAGKCRTWCQNPKCGDFILDDNEECDAGPDGSSTCSTLCRVVEPVDTGGCCSSSSGAAGPFALAGLVGLLARRRRRS